MYGTTVAITTVCTTTQAVIYQPEWNGRLQ